MVFLNFHRTVGIFPRVGNFVQGLHAEISPSENRRRDQISFRENIPLFSYNEIFLTSIDVCCVTMLVPCLTLNDPCQNFTRRKSQKKAEFHLVKKEVEFMTMKFPSQTSTKVSTSQTTNYVNWPTRQLTLQNQSRSRIQFHLSQFLSHFQHNEIAFDFQISLLMKCNCGLKNEIAILNSTLQFWMLISIIIFLSFKANIDMSISSSSSKQTQVNTGLPLVLTTLPLSSQPVEQVMHIWGQIVYIWGQMMSGSWVNHGVL